jgi:tetratricopeptide (TPR) repeat protein
MKQQAQLLLFMIPITIAFFQCTSQKQDAGDKLGDIEFPVQGNSEAQEYFLKGMLLLHSFEYDDAAENFVKAQQADSTCAMAYWGEAMTYNHPLWRYQNYEKGHAALAKLGSTEAERLGKATSDLEKDFLLAADTLYGKGSKPRRDSLYALYMGTLYRKYPGNNEVASLYSLSLLGSVEVGRNDEVYGHAAEIAKEVLERNPNHPGALHYLIHSYDDPVHAHMALTAADEYSVVAPAAGHALHMPTHIYVALGMWDKVVINNEDAWAATVHRVKEKNLGNDDLGYHYFHWLEYGYLQQGRIGEARKLLFEMKNYCDSLQSTRAREYVVYMKSTYLIESNDWSAEVTNLKVNIDDLNIATQAMDYFIEGLNAFRNGDENALTNAGTQLLRKRLVASESVTGSAYGVCGNVTGDVPNLLDVQQAEVMELELNAMEAWMKRDTAATDSLYRKATALESSISYSFGPPAVVKPSNELYAEWLLQVDRPAEALQQFQHSLKAAPRRVLSLQGVINAATQTGDNDQADQARKILDEISRKTGETINRKPVASNT